MRYGNEMMANLIIQLDHIIRLTETLLTECTESSEDKYSERLQNMVNQARFTQNELRLYVSPEGNIEGVPNSIGYYTRTHCAIFDTNLYLLQKYHGRMGSGLTENQMAILQEIEQHFRIFMAELYQKWSDRKTIN